MNVPQDNRGNPPEGEATVEHNNREIPPAVEPTRYEGPPKEEQKSWIRGTNLLILLLVIIFVVIIIIYVVTR